MRKNPYFVHVLLVLEVAGLCLSAALIRTWSPGVILPRVSLPFLVLLSLIPQVLRLYLAPNTHAPLIPSVLLAGVTFAVLPLCAGVDTGLSFWVLLVVGGVVFGAVSLLYASLAQRMIASASTPVAPAAQGLCLYLASQCLQGLL